MDLVTLHGMVPIKMYQQFELYARDNGIGNDDALVDLLMFGLTQAGYGLKNVETGRVLLTSRQTEFLGAWIKHESLSKTFAVLAMSPATPGRWMNMSPEFAAEYKKTEEVVARNKRRKRLEERIAKLAAHRDLLAEEIEAEVT